MSGGNIYRDCRAEGHARVHFGDIHNHSHTIPEDDCILKWLSPLSPWEKRNEALKRYQPGTLAWFFDNGSFTKWLDLDLDHPVNSVRVLWCRGDMGTGKSVLSSKVDEWLIENHAPKTHAALVYCRWSERHEQTVDHILGSVLAQLYAMDATDVPDNVRASYRQKTRYRRALEPTRVELKTWLFELACCSRKPSLLILDGLDELEVWIRAEILQILHPSSLPRFRIFITSRFAPDQDEVRDPAYPHEMLQFRATRCDIERFIVESLNGPAAYRLNRLTDGKRSMYETRQTMKEDIVARLLAKSSDMFLLARYHVERIINCRSVAEIDHCLDTLPEKLDDHYDQAWRRATCEGNLYKRTQAQHILMWTIFVEQPLSLRALTEAVSISMDIDSGLVNSTAMSVADIIVLCAGLVRVEGLPSGWQDNAEIEDCILSNAKIITVHTSASEYFYHRRPLYFPTSHEIINMTFARLIHNLAIEPYWGIVPLSSLPIGT